MKSISSAKIAVVGILMLPLLLFDCNRISRDQNKEVLYKLVSNENNLKVESFDSTLRDTERFNSNNKIFIKEREFHYSYSYRNKLGDIYYFNRNAENWTFTAVQDIDSSTITNFAIKVLPGTAGMAIFSLDYNQTALSYTLQNEDFFEVSGVIENEANIWMHPPREALFGILELNPFPYIQFPLQLDKKWNWELGIGSHWGDERWKEWEGSITNKYKYEVIGQEFIETNMGRLECFKVKSEAESRIGNTQLVFWFNDQFGFVKMNYVNIDGSQIKINLMQVY